MRLIRSQRAQSTAEYAVLFAIVIGAAIAMQQYVGGRLRGAVKDRADVYSTAAHNGLTTAQTNKFDDPARNSKSNSRVNLTMNTAKRGNVIINSISNSTLTK